MEEVQQQQQQQSALRPSFPPVAAVKWVQDLGPSAADGLPPDGAQSFGQDSGYTSYQATTPNNTFNLSSRHGISSVTLATIDEAGELDCSMNDTGGGGGPTGAINLTPKTAASMVLLSNIHLTTPKSTDRAKRIRRPIAFDYDGSGGSCSSSFLAPSTPERLPGLSRSVSFELPETPLRTGNRSASQPSSQLTPHKARGGSLKRKHSTFREKLYSDGDGVALPADENHPRDLNDSLDADCRRLEDISPILNVKRRKHQDRGIEDLMRSSTPKTASSQPTFLQVGAAAGRNPPLGEKRTFRKFQSFSPSKMQPNAARPLLRQNAIRALEHTPEKRKEQRVLAEIHPQPAVADAVLPPLDLAALLDAPILGEPSRQLEQTVTTVPSFDDFSLTPSKANLIDPELMAPAAEGPFATDDYLVRHASNFSYAPTLNSILEESPIKAAAFLPGKLPLPKTPPSVTKSGRKLKRLGTNGGSASSCASSPARSVRSLSSRHSARASVSPKATRRLHGAQPHNGRLKTAQPYSFCGCEYINILHQLSMRNPDALETLLDYLADTDLVQVVRVSRGWKAIIQNHKKSWRRLQRFLKQQEEHKENCHGSRWENGSFASSLNAGCSQLGTALPELLSGAFGKDSNAVGGLGSVEDAAVVPVPPPVPAADANAVPKRLPFKVCNSLDNSQASAGNASFAHGSFANVSGLELSRRRSSFAARASTSVAAQSPPVSPSMRKFVTNQKIASHLKQSEQLRPCPRCEQPSRIILSRASKSSKSRSSARFSAVGARLEKSYTLPDPETTTASGHRHSGSNNTHSSTIEAVRSSNLSTDTITATHRNNNHYGEPSPERVRKNLFNSSSSSSNTTPANTSTSSSCNEQRMKLRSSGATKSLDCSSTAAMHPAGGEDTLGVRDSKCDYAICSGAFCGFRFCIKCLCEYHPDTVCADLAANSPTKEEERGRPNMACSRQSRRSLQRLCRKL